MTSHQFNRLYPAGVSDDELFIVCQTYPELNIERDVSGKIIVMSPVGDDLSHKNLILSGLFYYWTSAHEHVGVGFDSSTGFMLPDGSMRSPDLAWIRRERWEKLIEHDRTRFAHICPDFVVELRSPSDPLRMLQTKMVAWMNNGCQLGWLIDLENEKAYIYTPDETLEEITGFHHKLTGGTVLPGFELDLLKLK
ncbi:MAG TPA: Uma2 family endonuclease [Chryseolinea sp.]